MGNGREGDSCSYILHWSGPVILAKFRIFQAFRVRVDSTDSGLKIVVLHVRNCFLRYKIYVPNYKLLYNPSFVNLANPCWALRANVNHMATCFRAYASCPGSLL